VSASALENYRMRKMKRKENMQ